MAVASIDPDRGVLELIVRRPAVDEREVLEYVPSHASQDRIDGIFAHRPSNGPDAGKHIPSASSE